MTALLVEAGDYWLLPFERIARIATAEHLRPYAFEVPQLDGLLLADEGLVPVWRPDEFQGNGQVIVLYYGDEGLAGLRVTQVHGVRTFAGETGEHGAAVALSDGMRGMWFDFDVMESRFANLALSGGMNAEEDIVG
jgi:hypothetical protein